MKTYDIFQFCYTCSIIFFKKSKDITLRYIINIY